MRGLRPRVTNGPMSYGHDPFMGRGDPRRHAPAADRNLEPIWQVLARWLPATGTVVEIASGTGQHVAGFAARAPGLTWQPTDPDAPMRASIDAHVRAAGLANVRGARDLDVTEPFAGWPIAACDAMLAVNLLHIAPWVATQGLFGGGGRLLPENGPLVIYGPFKRGGVHTATSNAQFDAMLKSQDDNRAIRDLDDVAAAAREHGLDLAEVNAMPANNLAVVFRRRP